MTALLEPSDFILTRKRKKYKFAHFANATNCFEADEFTINPTEMRPVIVEVGAGTGLFALELARLHPEKFYIATDNKAHRLQVGAKEALHHDVTNIVFVRIHAERLSQVLGVHRMSELWLTFSDPFPKKRHEKHRLTHVSFLHVYRELLKPDGLLKQKTDNLQLFEWSLEQLVTMNWHIRELSHDLHQSDLPEEPKIKTTYETRYHDKGLPIYYLSASC